MKRSKFLAYIVMMLMSLSAVAQSNLPVYRFNFLTYSGKTDRYKLIDRLEEEYEYEVGAGNNTVYYLADGSNPVIADMLGDADENQEAFDAMIRHLRSNGLGLNCSPGKDLDAIMDYLTSTNSPFDATGAISDFRSVELNFYIDSTFWTNMKGPQYLIAPLVYAFDVTNNDKIYINIFYDGQDDIDFDEQILSEFVSPAINDKIRKNRF